MGSLCQVLIPLQLPKSEFELYFCNSRCLYVCACAAECKRAERRGLLTCLCKLNLRSPKQSPQRNACTCRQTNSRSPFDVRTVSEQTVPLFIQQTAQRIVAAENRVMVNRPLHSRIYAQNICFILVFMRIC